MLNWTDERLAQSLKKDREERMLRTAQKNADSTGECAVVIDATGITNGATATPTDRRSRLQVLEDDALECLQIAEDTLEAGGRKHENAVRNYDRAQAKLDRYIARLAKFA